MTSAIASRSDLSIIAPVGLLGYGRISTFVFGVIASSSSATVSLNWFSFFRLIMTGFAPARIAQGSYET